MFGAGPAEYPQTDNLLGSLAFWTFLLLKLATNTGSTNHYYSLKNKKMSLWGYFYCDFLWLLSAFWRRSILEYLGLYVFIFQWVLCIFSPPKNLFETAVLMLRVHSSHSLTTQEATTASLSSSMLQRPHRPSPPLTVHGALNTKEQPQQFHLSRQDCRDLLCIHANMYFSLFQENN